MTARGDRVGERRGEHPVLRTKVSSEAGADDSQVRMCAMIRAHFRFVARSLRRVGVPPSDLDDEIQRTFIVAARRLETTPEADERKFLLGVTVNIAWHARRTLARRREVLTGQLPDYEEPLGTPEHLIERKRLRELVDRTLDELDEPLRTVLTLHEIEEMTLSDIAARIAIPRGTVASRLRRARAQFRDLAAPNAAWGGTPSGSTRAGGPALSRSEEASALEKALLEAGAFVADGGTLYARTLAALGVKPAPLSHA